MDKEIEELNRCLAEVNAEIGILLHKRILHISNQNDDLMTEAKGLRKQNDHLMTEVNGLRQQVTKMSEDTAQEMSLREIATLDHLRRLLGTIPIQNTDIATCIKTLESAFPQAMEAPSIDPGWSENYIQMTPRLLRSNHAFQSWGLCPSSSLLVFAGSTSEEGRASPSSSLSWLSPAAMQVYREVSSKGKKVAFHSCHPDLRAEPSSSRLVVSSLLSQLLAWKPKLPQPLVHDFEATVNSADWTSKMDTSGLKHRFGLVENVLSSLPAEEEIFMILDRLDLCIEHKNQYLKAFHRLTRTRSYGLKVVIIMDSIENDYDRGECRDLLSTGAENHAYGDLAWNQIRKSY